jgi:hypothetical protein
MAKRVIAYACEHGCRRRVLTSKRAMERHEEICFYNPERRACITCEHFECYEDSNGMEHTTYLEQWTVRGCTLDIDLTSKLKKNCPNHKIKSSNGDKNDQ